MSNDKQMQQIYKMADLGVMLSSTLHEIRQPLFAIKGLAQLMLHDAQRSGAIDDRLVRLLEVAQDLERILTSFLNFSRAPSDSLIPIAISVPLESALELTRHRIRNARIDLRISTEAVPRTILGNASALQQVFVNLLTNSIDALESRGTDPTRTIWLQVVASPDQTWLEILLGDNGIGIDLNHSSHVFQYFFTTKPEGKGTGLGLSIAADILRHHGGNLQLLESDQLPPDWTPRPATVFRLQFPLAVTSAGAIEQS